MTKRIPLDQWKPNTKTCSCKTCKGICKVPCWPSPEEAKRLIKLGYGPKMMVAERWTGPVKDKFISVLSPAKPGLEGGHYSYPSKKNKKAKGCVFQKKGLCQLHNICKPIEGRLAICEGREPVDLRDRVAMLWDNKKAQLLVTRWVKKFGKGGKTSWTRFNDGGYIYLAGAPEPLD